MFGSDAPTTRQDLLLQHYRCTSEIDQVHITPSGNTELEAEVEDHDRVVKRFSEDGEVDVARRSRMTARVGPEEPHALQSRQCPADALDQALEALQSRH